MSAYLQIIIMIAIRKDEHSAKVSQLSVRLRMGLKPNNPQSEIVKKLIDIHAQHVSLTNALSALRVYEAKIRSEESGKVVNQKLAGKIGQIRLAYEVIAENKAFVSKTYTNSQNNKFSKNTLISDTLIVLMSHYERQYLADTIKMITWRTLRILLMMTRLRS
ncbi:hypothetical protein [Psychrobacter sp. WY6]|uniref:hypothetical protein n=1 Tax=Psychrobacter sp. WY6 TaxID=2708350 RepID=UPI002022FA51|nr:hypothetical protein [Psychrobacter sp. WY6]